MHCHRNANTGGPAFSYDARGNLTGDGVTSYAYNANNLLISTGSVNATSPSPLAGAALTYDAENRLLSVTSGSGTQSQFVYDGTKLIAEYSGGTLLRTYVDGPATDDPLVWFEGTGTTDPRYYHVDEQGSIIGLSDVNGNTHLSPAGVKMILAYDEYGWPGSANLGRYQYTGQVWLPEVGLYYYKARLYSPTLGRFMQTDPIGYKDGMNWYAYVGDDPMDGTDPTGECDPKFDWCSHMTYNQSADQPKSIPITADERKMVASGNINGFYSDRLKKGDEYGKIGLAFGDLNTSDPAVKLSEQNLIRAIAGEQGKILPTDSGGPPVVIVDHAVMVEYQQIRAELAKAYVSAVDNDHSGVPHALSPEQFAQFHHEVFASHGISPTVFGGTPITGANWEADLTRPAWCGSCDTH